MMARPTIEKLAQVAGVSVATVDRVLNRRAKVRTKTAKRVYEAAVAIGYPATSLIGQRVREELPEYRLGFLLLDTGSTFYAAFENELRSAVWRRPTFAACLFSTTPSPSEPDQIAARLADLASRAGAVAVVAPEHPAVNAAAAALRSARHSDLFVALRFRGRHARGLCRRA